MKNPYLRLMRLDKPIGIYLLLYPTLWALWLASGGVPDIYILIIFILGVVLMRSAGCVINDIADRDIDKHIKRTNKRPITSGEVSVRSASYLFLALVVSAFLLVLLTNKLTVILAVIALLLATIYPFSKRCIYLPQLVLGLAFSMSIPMAFAATIGYVPTEALYLITANIIWTISYDTMYAIADREDDIKIGIKSSAILFGKYDLVILAILQALLLALLVVIGWVFMLGGVYFIGLLLVLALMVYYQLLIKNHNQQQCFKAFLHNQYLGLLVWLLIISSYY